MIRWLKRDRATPRIATDVGTFVFDDSASGSWLTECQDDDSVVITVTRPDFDFHLVEHAQRLLASVGELTAVALDYISKQQGQAYARR